MPLIQTTGAASSRGFGQFARTGTAVYIEDVFSTYLYDGTASVLTIVNGIDLAGKGGLVWAKDRLLSESNWLYDTIRGGTKGLISNSTAKENINVDISSFNSNGFTLPATSNINYGPTNPSLHSYASWTFRKQPKFFDVVTYTGTGSNTTISHNLGAVPGCILVKRTDTSADWQVYHRSLANTEYMVLNSTAASATGTTRWNSTTPTSTVFSIGTDTTVNASGGTYVAYLFAHDAGGFGASGTDNVISCGSFTTDGSGIIPTVTFGYEPQWVMLKPSSTTGNWGIADTMRGWYNQSTDQFNRLSANLSNAEVTGANGPIPTATGFTGPAVNFGAGITYIYIAIRRGPMRTPTSGTSVFSPTAWTGNDVDQRTFTGPNFPPDMLWAMIRGDTSGIQRGGFNVSRLVGTASGATSTLLDTTSTSAATTANPSTPSTGQFSSLNQDGFTVRYDLNRDYDGLSGATTQVCWAFRRAPGFFDVVCYTGTGSATTFSHNLGLVPEMMIMKRRNGAADWWVYDAATGNTKYQVLNSTNPPTTSSTAWNNTTPTSSVFSVGTGTPVNASAGAYVAYLFASCPGVSKVGSYTGTGTTLQVNCGFTTGARFVLIKRTDSTGDWYVWDSARGIVAGNDPYLLFNSTAAEVTSTDYVDTYNAGFEISSTAPAAINANGGTFIFLAIA